MADLIRQWSDELAGDPGSLVFLPLGETLRRQGQLDLAHKVALRGLQRHPHNADGHDLLARILVDRGDLQGALDEWDMVLRLIAGHAGAIKGMAYIKFQQGNLAEAEQLLQQLHAHSGDEVIANAIDTVRKSGAMVPISAVDPFANPRMLYIDIVSQEQAAMCLDKDGLVLAGAYTAADGQDVAQEVGAALSGVSDEAGRASNHLDMGAWRSITFETEAAVIALSPAPGGGLGAGGLIVVAAVPSTPLGLLRRQLDRCIARTGEWLVRVAKAGGSA